MSSVPPGQWPSGPSQGQWPQNPPAGGPGGQPWPNGQQAWPEQPPARTEWSGAPQAWPADRLTAPPRPSLPVVPTRYHGFWRTPRWAVWKPILGLIIGVAGYFLLSLLLSLLGLVIDARTGRISVAEHAEQLAQGGGLTPSLFILNNLSLAACILLAWAVGAIHGQRPGWLSSVVGRFRWRWFFGCIGWLLPLWVLVALVSSFIPALAGDSTPLRVTKDTWIMVAGVLLTTPLQCVGEEFGFRGLLNRAVASFVPQDTRARALVSALLGGTVSSVFFMFAHSAQDPWLNLFYFCFGAVACYLCHVSGGLEASSAMHIVNNMSSMVFLPFTDFSKMFDRSEGTGSPWGLVQLVVVAAGAAIITWRVRRRGIVAVTAPAASGQPHQSVPAVVGPGADNRTPGLAPQLFDAPGQQAAPVRTPAPSSTTAAPGPLPGVPAGDARLTGERPPWQPSAPPIGTPWDSRGRRFDSGEQPGTTEDEQPGTPPGRAGEQS